MTNVNKTIADISVIVANYNNALFLKDLFQSILNSTVLPRELIVIDDGSTDHSAKVIEEYLTHPFIHLIRFEQNRGFAHALNAGIARATGKYIARIDPDDMVLPERFEKQYTFLSQHPDIDLVGGNVIYFNGITGHDVLRSNFPLHHNQILAAYRSGDHGVQHPTVLVKREVIAQYVYHQHLYPAEDYDLFARMIQDGFRFANLADAMNRMRIHEGSVSNRICFNTVDQTFALRDEIFGIKSGSYQKKRYFWYILFYRKFLFSRNLLLKFIYLSIASLCHPKKVIMKIASMVR